MYLRKYSLSKKFPVFEMSHMKWPLYEISYIYEIFSIKCPSAPKKAFSKKLRIIQGQKCNLGYKKQTCTNFDSGISETRVKFVAQNFLGFWRHFSNEKNKYEIKNCQGKINWFRISFTVTLKKTPNNEDCAKCQIMPRWTLLKQDWFIDCTIILKHYSHF